jgi:hypothetical protein
MSVNVYVRISIRKGGERGLVINKYEEICLYVDGKIVHSTNISIFFNVVVGNSAQSCSAH